MPMVAPTTEAHQRPLRRTNTGAAAAAAAAQRAGHRNGHHTLPLVLLSLLLLLLMPSAVAAAATATLPQTEGDGGGSGEEGGAEVRWLLLRIAADGRAEVVGSEVRPAQTHAITHRTTTNREDTHIYYHARGRTVHTRSAGGLWVTTGDWINATKADGGGYDGARTAAESGYVTLHVPSVATHLTVVKGTPPPDRSTSTSTSKGTKAHTLSLRDVPLSLSSSAKGKFGTAAGAPEMRVMQQVGPPSQQKNLVFLSAGYAASERAAFFAHVSAAVDFLTGSSGSDPTATHIDGNLLPSPWDRYMSLINVYAVYQESAQSGASFPVAADGSGGHPTLKREVKKDNNLNCEYGAKVTRFLRCDYALMATLGSYAPADPSTTTLIALVNQPDVYGGSGGNHTCSVYNGPKMLNVLIHELGHADADLSDEYDYSFTESKHLGLVNCHWEASNPPWSYWIGRGLSSPSSVCSYSNYYKPTVDKCLMNKVDVLEQCPVCAEGSIRAIYGQLTNLAGQRCPRVPETVVVTTANENAYIYMGYSPAPVRALSLLQGHYSDGTSLRQDNGAFVVTYQVPGSSTVSYSITRTSAARAIPINGQQLARTIAVNQVAEVKVTIEDQSEFVSKATRTSDDPLSRMRFTTTVRVLLVDKANATFAHCTPSGLRAYSGARWLSIAPAVRATLNNCSLSGEVYCAICDKGQVCNDTYPVTVREVTVNADAALKKIEGVVFGVGGACFVVGVVGFILLWLLLTRHFANDVNEVIPYPPVLRYARLVMLGISVVIMVFAVVIIFLSAWGYNEMTAYGKAFLIVLVAFACLLFILAFIGFTAAYSRSRLLLSINGVLLVLSVVILLVFGSIALYVGVNCKKDSFRDSLAKAWNKQVESNPRSVCTFQQALKCSGFIASCHNKYNSECPVNCETTNRRYTDPCYDTFVYRLRRALRPVGGVLVALTVAMLLAVGFNWALCCCLHRRRATLRRRFTAQPKDWQSKEEAEFTQAKAIVILKSLSEEEREQMKQEFKKVDANGDGKLSPAELQVFLRKAFGQELTLEEVHEAVFRVDPDGDGRVNFHEFVAMFSNEKEEAERKERFLSDPRLRDFDRGEVLQLLEDFRRADKDGTGTITLRELQLYYKRLYGVEPDPLDVKRALSAVENGNSSEITFFEFVRMFSGKPGVARQQSPQQQQRSPSPQQQSPVQQSPQAQLSKQKEPVADNSNSNNLVRVTPVSMK